MAIWPFDRIGRFVTGSVKYLSLTTMSLGAPFGAVDQLDRVRFGEMQDYDRDVTGWVK